MNASDGLNPLISASELLGALEGGSPLVLVDARFWLGQHGRGRAAYEAGHIPGARFVDVDEELAEPARGDGIRPGTSARGRHPRPSAERLTGAVGRLGINDDSSVVVYDQGTSLAAAWFRWLLSIVAVAAASAWMVLWLSTNPQVNHAWVALLLPVHAALAYVFVPRHGSLH